MKRVLVVGLGEIGRPLLEIVRGVHDAYGFDLKDAINYLPNQEFDVIHICYPYSPSFAEITIEYIETLEPKLTLIETTVHPEPSEFLNAEMLYTGKRSITYDPIAWFNELGWREDKAKTGKYRRLLRA